MTCSQTTRSSSLRRSVIVVWILVAPARAGLAGVRVQPPGAAAQRGRPGLLSIDIQLKRRADLIPNLVESVKAYARMRGACSRRWPRRGRGRSTPRPSARPPTPSGRCAARWAGCSPWPRPIRSCAPARTSSTLQEELSDTEDKIAAARRYYNNVVQRYNTTQQTFPTALSRGRSASARASSSSSRTRAIGRRSRSSCDAPGADPLQPASHRRWCSGFSLLIRPSSDHGRGLLRRAGRRDRDLHDQLRADLLLRVGPDHRRRLARQAGDEISRACTGCSRTSRSPPGCRRRPLYLIDDTSPNAFAAGRDPEHAYVAVTTGMLG